MAGCRLRLRETSRLQPVPAAALRRPRQLPAHAARHGLLEEPDQHAVPDRDRGAGGTRAVTGRGADPQPPGARPAALPGAGVPADDRSRRRVRLPLALADETAV